MAKTKKTIINKVYSSPENTSKIFRQYDTRWGSLYYPDKTHTIARCGCGCCSVTHCALENPAYANYTPRNVQPFMKQYAKAGKGTLQEGIIKGLEKYGYSNIVKMQVKGVEDLTPVWDQFKKGKKGVLLFRGLKKDKTTRTPDGTVWTEKGHYVSVVGFKIVGNKHYLYTKDSGRGHDGWWCYETSMKNSLKTVFLGTPPRTDLIILPKRGYFKKGDTGRDVTRLQVWLTDHGFFCGPINGIYGKKVMSAVRSFEKLYKLKEDGLWGKKCQAKYLQVVKK